jgi:hypothetical protein
MFELLHDGAELTPHGFILERCMLRVEGSRAVIVPSRDAASLDASMSQV